MEILNLIFTHGKDIMYILVGISVFIVSISLSSALFNAAKILRKINKVADFLEQYLEKPKQILMLLDGFLSRFL